MQILRLARGQEARRIRNINVTILSTASEILSRCVVGWVLVWGQHWEKAKVVDTLYTNIHE